MILVKNSFSGDLLLSDFNQSNLIKEMAGAEIALVCGSKFRVVCQDRLCMNSDADETLANGKADL